MLHHQLIKCITKCSNYYTPSLCVKIYSFSHTALVQHTLIERGIISTQELVFLTIPDPFVCHIGPVGLCNTIISIKMTGCQRNFMPSYSVCRYLWSNRSLYNPDTKVWFLRKQCKVEQQVNMAGFIIKAQNHKVKWRFGTFQTAFSLSNSL